MENKLEDSTLEELNNLKERYKNELGRLQSRVDNFPQVGHGGVAALDSSLFRLECKLHWIIVDRKIQHIENEIQHRTEADAWMVRMKQLQSQLDLEKELE